MIVAVFLTSAVVVPAFLALRKAANPTSHDQRDDLPSEAPLQRARRLNDLGNVQKSLGRRSENLATTRKAVDRFRQLVEHHPNCMPTSRRASPTLARRSRTS